MLEELCKRIQHCCTTLWRSRNKRNVNSCWLKRSTRRFQTLRSNNSQQHATGGVETDTNYNIQQCLQGALKNCRFYEGVLPAKCPLRIRIECRGFAAKGANSRL